MCRSRVKSVVWKVGQSLPVYSDKRTILQASRGQTLIDAVVENILKTQPITKGMTGVVAMRTMLDRHESVEILICIQGNKRRSELLHDTLQSLLFIDPFYFLACSHVPKIA